MMADRETPRRLVSVGARRYRLTPADARFPEALADQGIKELFCVGNLSVLKEPTLAVAGSRRATPYGIAASEIAGRVAAECDVVVLTSAAAGCEHAAARSALDGGGRVLIVSGCGADVAYPKSSLDVFEDAKASGSLIVSAERWGSLPKPEAFVRKSEIIACLASSLLVAEACDRSSTIRTARLARAKGANVYAVPGSIFSTNSAGTNCLLQEGAYPIASERDLMERIALDFDATPPQAEEAKTPLGAVLQALSAMPMRPDDLAEKADVSVLTMLRTILDYEEAGIVQRMMDGRYSLTPASYERLRSHADELSLI